MDDSSPLAVLGSTLEGEMLTTAVMTVLCMAGVAFFARFLVALCKEFEPRLIGYWVRLEPGSGEEGNS